MSREARRAQPRLVSGAPMDQYDPPPFRAPTDPAVTDLDAQLQAVAAACAAANRALATNGDPPGDDP